jgi:hypothetical protein
MGVIAQEVERVYPSLVETTEGGYLGVDYAKLVGVLIEAVKELDADVRAMRRRGAKAGRKPGEKNVGALH